MRHYIWNDFNTLMAQVVEMDIEVVFVRSKYNEFFTSPFDNRRKFLRDDILFSFLSFWKKNRVFVVGVVFIGVFVVKSQELDPEAILK